MRLVPPRIDTSLAGCDKLDFSTLAAVREKIAMYEHTLAFYTDASKVEKKTAIGVYCQKLDIEIALRTPENLSI